MICSSVNRDRLMSASFRRTPPKSGGNLGSQVKVNYPILISLRREFRELFAVDPSGGFW